MSGRRSGIVKWFNDSRGYGFITPDDGGTELFAHFSQVQSGTESRELVEKVRVEFEVVESLKGPQAANISLLT